MRQIVGRCVQYHAAVVFHFSVAEIVTGFKKELLCTAEHHCVCPQFHGVTHLDQAASIAQDHERVKISIGMSMEPLNKPKKKKVAVSVANTVFDDEATGSAGADGKDDARVGEKRTASENWPQRYATNSYSLCPVSRGRGASLVLLY